MKKATIAAVLIIVGMTAFSQIPAAALAWPLLDTGGRQWLSSGYGVRESPMGGETSGFHAGIDLACRVGTPVLAVADGTVIVCAFDDPVYGRYLVLRLDNGFDALYAHLSETWYARGARVARGAIVGRSGNSGASTGPHLHFALMVDPFSLVASDIAAEWVERKGFE